MKPSRTELNSQTGNNITQKNKIKCPDGTIPVLRNTKDFLTSANLFPENYVHPQSVDSPGTHVSIHFLRSHAGPYRGIQAWVYGVDLKIEKDQASYSQIYLGSDVNNKINYISAGFMINPGYILATDVFGHMDFGRVKMERDVTIQLVQGLFKYHRRSP
uniref:Neprosin domain-containing protein n=1 Tax=Brassica oleracea TaxID=3712 RepID=A0A3P6E327_BRAOL|nr:unnamed protein product [Brassica oleracea]